MFLCAANGALAYALGPDPNPVHGIVSTVISLWIALALAFKRFHDRDQSGWFLELKEQHGFSGICESAKLIIRPAAYSCAGPLIFEFKSVQIILSEVELSKIENEPFIS